MQEIVCVCVRQSVPTRTDWGNSPALEWTSRQEWTGRLQHIHYILSGIEKLWDKGQ